MFIEMNLGGVAEPKPVAPGRYALTIADAKYREAKGDIQVSIGIDGHLDAPNVSHYISFPKKDDDAGKAAFKKLMLKRFLVQFNISHDDASGFDVADFLGATADAQLSLSEPDDSGNVYNRLALEKLADEGSAPQKKVGKKS